MAISHKSLCNVKIALHKGHPRATFPDATIQDTRGTGCLYIISLLETLLAGCLYISLLQ